MKAYLIRSTFIGAGAMMLLVIPFTILTILRYEPGTDFAGVVYLAWFTMSQPALICLPILLLLTTIFMWFQTKEISVSTSPSEAKKRLMISVWVSTAIATAPLLLLSLLMLIYSLTTQSTNGEDAAGLGMAMFFSMLCMFGNIFLIVVAGLLARLLITKEKTEHPSVV